ncbi:unnamed protein product [Spirodela intermedia]|uniref:Uncharacterized protein n=1 Tax=Spirodela intermedia TaxID=51605 RepID=A0A7I8L0T0_SPIIN|nr:unnamed protein product [Spirodela intermedia]
MKTPDTFSLWRNGEENESNSSASSSLMAVLATVLVVSIVFYFFRRTKNGAYLLPPGPRGLPLLGSLPFLRSDLHVYFAELARTYGPVMSLRLGAKLCVVLSSPEAVKEALRDQDVVFANRDVPMVGFVYSYGGKNLAWAPYGPHWRMLRKVSARELFNPATIDSLSIPRQDEIRRMVEEIRRKAGQSVNLRELVFAVTMKLIAVMLWGGSLPQKGEEGDAVWREIGNAVDKIVSMSAVPNISDFYPALAWLDLQGLVRRMRRLCSVLDHILNSIIEERLMMMESCREGDPAAAVDKKNRDFLQVLLDLVQNPDPQGPMTMEHTKALLLDLVAGGMDTMSTTVEWAMAELLNDPERMRTAQHEIAAVVGKGSAVEEVHLPRLRYLDAVVRETLRLHPVVPLFPRCPSSTCTVGGFRIPEGTNVLVNVWEIHRDPRIWEDASKFKPERFLSEAGRVDYSGKTFRYLPFGTGRRICPGILLGERMVMFILASLLHSADWALPEGGAAALDLNEKFGIVMRKEKALVAVPNPR